jgi:hypothetical protein
MSITVSISSKAQSKLEKRAAVFGQDLKTFVSNLLEREASQSLLEAAKPIHLQSERLQISESELDNLINETLSDVRSEKPLKNR